MQSLQQTAAMPSIADEGHEHAAATLVHCRLADTVLEENDLVVASSTEAQRA